MLSRWFLDYSVSEGAFVIGLSQISSFFFVYHTSFYILKCYVIIYHFQF